MDNSSTDGFGGRLSEVIGSESVNSFAKRCGISEGSIRNYLKDKVPGADIALRIADIAGVDFEWLVSGRERKQDGQRKGGIVFTPLASRSAGDGQGERVDELSEEEFVFQHNDLIAIPAYSEVRPAAGAGTIATSDMPTSFVAFNRRWLRDIGVNPVFASIMIAEGDSMYPTIPNGSPMLVDTSKTEIRHGCIYAFDLDGDLMVKRIERLPDGTIDLISDNDRYPTRNVTRDRLEQMNVIGRVFSAVRTF